MAYGNHLGTTLKNEGAVSVLLRQWQERKSHDKQKQTQLEAEMQPSI